MATTRTICYYAMYVIGEVESNWDWTSIYYSDPITIGMMQWYGTRAAALLGRIQTEQPAAYATLAESLRSDLSAHNANDTYWNRRYLNEAEGQSIVSVFSSTENHAIQENQAISDFEGYISTLEGWGMSQTHPKALIFAMCMYHQSPRQAGQVVASAGGNADLEKLYQVCMNDGVLGRYRNRYTTAYNRLNAWDGESDPPDFGQSGDSDVGGDTGIAVAGSQLSHIIESGDTLVLYGSGALASGVVFYPASGQRWICGHNAYGTQITGGNFGGGTGTRQDVVDLYTSWVGRFAYSQAPGRLTPLTSGYGDCSSTIWAAYHDAAGIDVGTWTGAMVGKGSHIAGGSGANLPLSSMQPGDLILFWRTSSSPQHVEMYVGNNQLCGHGGPGNGPTIKADAQTYVARWGSWEVRRY